MTRATKGGISRRGFFMGVAAAAGALALPRGARAAWDAVSAVGTTEEDFVERHGMSLFGPLEMPPDFKHFPYVNPQAPKGGEFSQQIRQIGLNQNFSTFNTLNTYVLQGDGAAGMDATYDTLMSGSSDEPDALYGLVAQSVSRSRDGLVFRWRLRPQARFHDGSPLTAEDVAFSITILRDEGHPNLAQLLRQIESATALEPHLVEVRFVEGRTRDIPLTVAALPIFSKAYWEGRDFTASTLEPPLGSGPYRVGDFEVGRTISFQRVEDYWGADLPVNVGLINFDRIRYEYFRDRDVAFEAFKAGQFSYHEESVSRQWARGYDFPAFVEGRVVREDLPTAVPQGPQGWWYNTRLSKFSDKRIREALIYAFDFEWTNENIMFSSYARMHSFFENSDLKAEGPPSPEELALLEPFRAGLPDEVFGEAWTPPVSDGSGQDRALLRRASELLREAGCERRGSVLHLPSGEPFTIEFLDFASFLQPHTQPFQSNLGLLGIQATSRIVDPAQYERRMNDFDFEVTSRRFGASLTPGGSLRLVYGSEAAVTPGTANLSGVQDPAVDALIEVIANAQTREEVIHGGRALDRVLRAGRYMVPAWFKPADWLAYWDEYSRPETKPRYGTGVGTWWYDPEKAARARRR
ncbi:extracellular solute-binding protein [Salinarimonas ramus]|uniref:ABC transporter substrate-binding protein n=1 Tax=Salinarimonas ramus TaxID=690164 RepID=A0A917QAS5_9HYPH|nr:extracellular solute-binding protein [Salinarimonas ramus]GGK39901.1 ABC transporter substrate-binding protein [Salinarimonas ramus]